MRHTLILSFFILLVCHNYGQKSKDFNLLFNAKFGNTNLTLNGTYYKINKNDSIQFEVLKFYVSSIQFLNNNKVIWKEKNSFHLIDFENLKSQTILFNIPTDLHFTEIKFNLGIDSITSNSGALAGDLDPTKGMYWAWQSGYINFKMEGNSTSCNTRKHQFQFHFGGYKQPYYAMQTISLPITNLKNKTLIIDFNLIKFFEKISLNQTNSIMIPSKEAMDLSKVIASLFYIDEN